MDTPHLMVPIVLRGAATHIIINGWCRTDMFGPHTIGDRASTSALGAIWATICHSPDYPELAIWASAAFASYLNAWFMPRPNSLTGVARYPKSKRVITSWNNRDGRTADQVVTALRAAADRYESECLSTIQ
jgi:hypothetical protein